ncbi:MAG TPA: nicotinamide-nucleotide adenylyltransferase [Nitrososphaera sp.]|nr:nicotinamide-nucleotide adenylyltransferase [Nitrososphaera sp.]
MLYIFKIACKHISLLTTTGLFIGRFQPFHKGHLAAIKFALDKVDQIVIVVGSAQKSHESRNPFTAGERVRMIKDTLDSDGEIDVKRILIIPVPDVNVHMMWTRQIDMLVPKYDMVFANDPFTLLLFRERDIRAIEVPFVKRDEMAATEVRKRMVSDEKWQDLVPSPVARVIQEIDGVKRVKTIAEKQIFDHSK